MKPRFSKKRNSGMTLLEVGVAIAVVMILVCVFLSTNDNYRVERRAQKISCVSNLKQIGLSYRLWEGDHGDTYPTGVSVTNGGSMEIIATGDVLQTFLVMSNELSTPKILFCPADATRTMANSFAALASSNISYFISADATNDQNKQLVVFGDDNFAVGGVPVKPGLLELSKNAPVAWTSARHHQVSEKPHFWTTTHEESIGNLILGDCSVQQVNTENLQNTLRQTGLATNRLAIP